MAVGVGIGVGVGVAVGNGVGTGVHVGSGVQVGSGVHVGAGGGVGVGAGVSVGSGVAEGSGLAVTVGNADGTGVGVTGRSSIDVAIETSVDGAVGKAVEGISESCAVVEGVGMDATLAVGSADRDSGTCGLEQVRIMATLRITTRNLKWNPLAARIRLLYHKSPSWDREPQGGMRPILALVLILDNCNSW